MFTFFWKKKVGSANDFLCDIKCDSLLLGEFPRVWCRNSITGKVFQCRLYESTKFRAGQMGVCSMCWVAFSIPSVRTLLIASNRLSDPTYLSKGGFIR